MSSASKIEWTESTWNPIVGCSVLSPGCTNCYAMRMAARVEAADVVKRDWAGNSGPPTPYLGTTRRVNGNAVWTGKVALAPDKTLLEPLRRRKPTTYFVNSMGDLFHDSVPDEWIDRVFAVMRDCPQHTFQVLTKRAERMRAYFAAPHPAPNVRAWQARVSEAIDAIIPQRTSASVDAKSAVIHHAPLPNVWLGVSAERQQEADERIPHLLATPAAVRFVSCEPLLGPIDLHNLTTDTTPLGWLDALRCIVPRHLDWIIVGGESGPAARPMHPQWARDLRDQCQAAGVPFFFKQWGAYQDGSDFKPGAIVVMNDGRTCEFGSAALVDMDREKPVPPTNPTMMQRVGKKAAGRLLDGREWNEMPVRA